MLGLHMRLLSLLRLQRKQFLAAIALDVTRDATIEARLARSTSGMLRGASSHVRMLHPILLASAKQLLDEDLLLSLSHHFLRVIGKNANGEHCFDTRGGCSRSCSQRGLWLTRCSLSEDG